MAREQCPVCSASDIEELIVLEDYPYAGNGVVRKEVAEEVEKGSLGVAICRSCGALFQSDPPSAEELDKMLSLQPSPRPIEETGMESSEMERFLEAVEKYAPGKGRVLEIGCGTGPVLAHLKEKGYDVVGIDANPAAVEEAKKRGLDVTLGRFEEGMFEDESFDLIIATSVLDHVIDPTPTLATVENLLLPGGVFAVEVPNIDRIIRRSGFGGFTRHHTIYWGVPTLRYALTLQGLDVLGGFEESYVAMFAQKVEKGEQAIEPVPPPDEQVEETIELANAFLDRKDLLAEKLPGVVREQFPGGVLILGAGPPTVDLLYYSGMRNEIKGVLSTDSGRHGSVLAGYGYEIQPFEAIEGDGFDGILVSSERRQEELLEMLESYLDKGGHVIRFKPEIEVI